MITECLSEHGFAAQNKLTLHGQNRLIVRSSSLATAQQQKNIKKTNNTTEDKLTQEGSCSVYSSRVASTCSFHDHNQIICKGGVVIPRGKQDAWSCICLCAYSACMYMHTSVGL